MHLYKDRNEAAVELAARLKNVHVENAAVYFLPRGGVVLGDVIAHELDAPLDMLTVRKVGYPGNLEYAMCAIDESGVHLCHEEEVGGFDSRMVKSLLEQEQAEAKRRREVYANGEPRMSAKDKTAIIVDDGIATGLTMKVAIKTILNDHPKEIIIAVPVAPKDTVLELLKIDRRVRVITLNEDPNFIGAVGSYYENFPQLTDHDVLTILKNHVSHH